MKQLMAGGGIIVIGTPRRFGMFSAKIPRHTRQNAITEGDLECILTRNCEGTEQLQYN